jgi:K+-transporting ATPase ATPase C chain
MNALRATIRPAIVSLLLFTVLLGIGYPLIVGAGALVFSREAHGSLIRDASGTVIGSDLVGQPFDDPAYFWSRPSAGAYNAMASSGTNAGPTGFIDKRGTLGPNPVLTDAVKARIQALHDADPRNPAPVPVDLVTASASGLDPHISPAAAYYQVARVARLRGVVPAAVRALVDDHVEERTWGFLGERRVNVVRLNLALDAAFHRDRAHRVAVPPEPRR